MAKIRYRQEDQICFLKNNNNGTITVQFEKPQRAIASGQICVIYENDIVRASGIIL